MVVERISFPGGITVIKGKDPVMPVIGALDKGKGSVTPMPSGEYDITPPEMTHNRYSYSLRVYPDGTGECTMTPVVPGASVLDPETGITKIGKRVDPIAEGSQTIMIAGPDERNRSMLIYEVLLHTPGRSPEA